MVARFRTNLAIIFAGMSAMVAPRGKSDIILASALEMQGYDIGKIAAAKLVK